MISYDPKAVRSLARHIYEGRLPQDRKVDSSWDRMSAVQQSIYEPEAIWVLKWCKEQGMELPLIATA